MEFLVPIYSDPRVRGLVERPAKLIWLENGLIQVKVIPKPFIVCDGCNARVALTPEEVEEEGLPVGYALCDKEAILEVVCQKCVNRHFSGLRVFRTLREAGV